MIYHILHRNMTRHDRQATRQKRQVKDTTRHPQPKRHDKSGADAAEVGALRAEVAALRSELACWRAEIATLRSSLPLTAAPALPSALDAEALVGRIVGALDALRVVVCNTTRQSDTLTLETTQQHDTPKGATEGAGAAADLAALQQLVLLATDKRGKTGSISGAARLLGVTEGGVRHALKVGRLTDDLAARVRVALARM